MSYPNIPDVTTSNDMTREDSMNLLLASVAFDFPSADSSVIGSMGFVNDDEFGFFWSVDRGDRVSQTFSASDFINKARLEVEVVTNILSPAAFVALELVIGGVSVGSFTVEDGFIGKISIEFTFPKIQGPLYQVDLRVSNEVQGGQGSITLAYASDFAHSLTLSYCEQLETDLNTAAKKIQHSPTRSQTLFRLDLNNREP